MLNANRIRAAMAQHIGGICWVFIIRSPPMFKCLLWQPHWFLTQGANTPWWHFCVLSLSAYYWLKIGFGFVSSDTNGLHQRTCNVSQTNSYVTNNNDRQILNKSGLRPTSSLRMFEHEVPHLSGLNFSAWHTQIKFRHYITVNRKIINKILLECMSKHLVWIIIFFFHSNRPQKYFPDFFALRTDQQFSIPFQTP